MPQIISESHDLLEADLKGKDGRHPILILTPGWGSSGYYSPEVVEAAAPLVPAGTHMYLDHPTPTEEVEQPVRSVRKIAAVTTEAARWDADRGGLVAECKVVAPYRDLIEDLKGSIGLSIRGSATDVTEGEVDGRTGRIIEGLAAIDSVDFVTRAGRGGKILDVLESADVNRRALDRGVAEATVNDRREALSTLVKDTHGGDKIYVWLRDFDDTTAWFDVESTGDAGTWQQTYSSGADGLPSAMTGERIEVRPVTQYHPVHPAGGTPTQESKEDTMATKQIEESEYTRLSEAAGRVSVLEAERDTARTERDEAKRELAESKRAARLDSILAEADADFTPLELDGLKSKAVVNEDGTLDEDAFKKTVTEAAAAIAEANGAGRPRGHGRRPTVVKDEVSEADLDSLDDAIYGEIKEA